MTRPEFETLTPKQKKKHIVKQIHAFYDSKNNQDICRCELSGCNGSEWVKAHHIWYRTFSPLWYHQLFENMILACGKCHGQIHNSNKKFPELEKIIERLKADDMKYKSKYTLKSK